MMGFSEADYGSWTKIMCNGGAFFERSASAQPRSVKTISAKATLSSLLRDFVRGRSTY
jgi:hypothetical protein